MKNLPADANKVFQIARNNALAAGATDKEATDAAWAAVKLGWEYIRGDWVPKKVKASSSPGQDSRPKLPVPRGRAREEIAPDINRFQKAYGVFEQEEEEKRGK